MPTYESHVTTSPVFDRPAKITYPFASQGDIATKIVHQPLLQLADRYVPPTLGSVFSSGLANLSGSPVTIGDAYCIGDTEPQPTDSGLVSFTRMWSNIPAPRTVPTGTTLNQFVGLPIGATEAAKTVTAMVFASPSVLTIPAHGYSVGDLIHNYIEYNQGAGKASGGAYSVIEAVTTNTVTVGWRFIGFDPGYFSFLSGTSIKCDNYRATFQAKITTLTRHEYALPGVTPGISTSEDFLPSPEFKPIVTATGQSIADFADQGNRLGTGTTPTASQYRQMMKNKEMINVESDIKLWQGSILERRTLMVRAI